MIRVMIVAEMGLLRGALTAVVADQPDMVTVGAAPGVDAPVQAPKWRPDVIVMDLDLVDLHTAVLIRQLADELPEAAVVVLTAQRTPAALRRALDAQARAFLSKDLSPVELVEVVRAVAAGSRVIDPATAIAALTAVQNPLTEREREVLRAAAAGLSTREIAAGLFLTQGTVRNHLSAIVRKLGERNRWSAIRRCQDAGWL